MLRELYLYENSMTNAIIIIIVEHQILILKKKLLHFVQHLFCHNVPLTDRRLILPRYSKLLPDTLRNV